MDYLSESYGGSSTPLYPDKGFCCYIVYDKKRNKYYSGMKSYMGREHPVGKTYFTSSTVTDFKTRFSKNPDQFLISVEYFPTLIDMVEAEKLFHKKFNVGKNLAFYNAISSGGSNCGASSVLCRDTTGKTYRVSSEEYKTGKHTHVCKNRMLVYIDGQSQLTSISKDEFDSTRMKTQFDGHVLCFDKKLNKNVRIKKEIFEKDTLRYQGITKGQRTAKRIRDGKKVTFHNDSYDKSEVYFDCIAKTIKVYDLQDKTYKSISRDEYQKKDGRYQHANSHFLNRIDLIQMQKRRVPRVEYDNMPNIFADLNAEFYYVYDGQIFGSWAKISRHLKVSYYANKNQIINQYNIEVRPICLVK
jgi:hypothetical protein